MQTLTLHKGPLDTLAIYANWHAFASEHNLGASVIFTGVVRAENGYDGLSFDIYPPLLEQWFNAYCNKAKLHNVILTMPHAIGDVPNHKSSYMAGIFSRQRRAALGIFEDFIEDFKHHAPIWKYDLKHNQRFYAKERSHHLPHSGILDD